MDGFGRHYQETGGVRIWLLREKMMIDDQQTNIMFCSSGSSFDREERESFHLPRFRLAP
jgi:hypothetical protein